MYTYTSGPCHTNQFTSFHTIQIASGAGVNGPARIMDGIALKCDLHSSRLHSVRANVITESFWMVGSSSGGFRTEADSDEYDDNDNGGGVTMVVVVVGDSVSSLSLKQLVVVLSKYNLMDQVEMGAPFSC